MKNDYAKCPTDPQPRKTDWYRLRYVSVWSVGFLSLGGAIALFVLAIVWSVPRTVGPVGNTTTEQHPERTAAVMPLAVALIVLFFLMYGPAARLRFRAGSGLFGGIGGEPSAFAPSSLQELRANCARARVDGTVLSTIGAAWSNTLAQRTTLGRRLYMRRMVGRTNDLEGLTWLAGTPLKQVQASLALEGKQLIGVPSSSYVTLGAWVATFGHGNSGADETHGVVIARALVLDQLTGVEFEAGPERLVDCFGKGQERARQFVVMTVTVGEKGTLYKNTQVLREGRRVQTLEDAKWALRPATLLRAIFIGNGKTLALTWVNYSGEPQAENLGKKVALFVFAALGWSWSMPKYEGTGTSGPLSEAIYLFPDSFNPPQLYFQMFLAIVNYELFTADLTLTPDLLLRISQTLHEVHAKHGGRTELRTLGKIVYFDVAMRENTTAFRAVFSALASLGIKRMAQHPGKFSHDPAIAACEGVEMVTVYEVVR